MNDLLPLISILLAIGLLIVALVTSVYGPPTWLRISAVCAFFCGVALGLAGSGTLQERLIAGTCFGPALALFIAGIGWKVRRDQGIKFRR